jgi:hypothetical protein
LREESPFPLDSLEDASLGFLEEVSFALLFSVSCRRERVMDLAVFTSFRLLFLSCDLVRMELFRCLFALASGFLLLLRSRCDSLLECCEVLFFSSAFSVWLALLFLLSDDFCLSASSFFLELDGLPRFFSEDL